MATCWALSCAEVVDLICCQCDEPTLASLARTRRDISEIALNVLWYSIPSIGFLIRCMPEDLWKVHFKEVDEEDDENDEEEDDEDDDEGKLVIMLLLCIRALLFNEQAEIPKVNPSNRLAQV